MNNSRETDIVFSDVPGTYIREGFLVGTFLAGLLLCTCGCSSRQAPSGSIGLWVVPQTQIDAVNTKAEAEGRNVLYVSFLSAAQPFQYDGKFVTVEIYPWKAWEWHAKDYCYRLESRWCGPYLYFKAPFGGGWRRLAKFEDGRFRAEWCGIIWFYENVRSSGTHKDHVLLARREPFNYSTFIMFGPLGPWAPYFDAGVKGEAEPPPAEDLYEAAKRGDMVAAKALFVKGAGVNDQDRYGQTPLQIAVASGNRRMVKFLIDRGANVNQLPRQEDWWWDSEKDNVRVINAGELPLVEAVCSGDREMVKLLLKRGADINLEGSHFTPLAKAIDNWDLPMVKLLVANSAGMKTEDRRHIAIIDATIKGFCDIVEFLINSSADVNARNQYEYTALHFAAYTGFEDIAELLIRHGADVNAVNDSGQTPLDIAKRHESVLVAQLLRRHGAKASSAGQGRQTDLRNGPEMKTQRSRTANLAGGRQAHSPGVTTQPARPRKVDVANRGFFVTLVRT